MSGTGGGVEDIDLGFGKIAVAWFRNVNDQFRTLDVTDADGNPATIDLSGGSVDGGRINVLDNAQNRFDLRLYGIETNPGGNLTIGLDLRHIDEDRDNFDPDNGWGVNLLHFQNDVFGGFNKIIFQYGRDAAANIGNGFIISDANDGNNDADPWTFRVVEQMLVQPTDDFSALGTIIYERNEDWFYTDGRDRTWFSAGIRPKYYFNDYLNLAFEVGYDYVDIDDKTSHLWKFTPALQLSAGRGFFARPAIRIFATYATWDDTATERGIAEGRFDDDDSGWTYGVQAETWW
jgi:maltoporin